MSRLCIKAGLVHLGSTTAQEGDRARGLGFKFNRYSGTFCAPASYRAMLDIKQAIPGYTVSADPETTKCMEYLRDKYAQDRFLARYLDQLVSGKRQPDLGTMRFKEGIAPKQHQLVALDFVRLTDDLALFWDCGLGKTFVICQWAQYLKDTFGTCKTLIVAPKSTLYATWVSDMRKFSWLQVCVLDQSSDANKKTLTKSWVRESKNQDYDVYVVAFDSVEPIKKELMAMKFGLMAVDESTFIKNPKAKRAKAVVSVADSVQRKAVMAGLPTPNKPDNIFMQMRALGPEYFGHDYYAFMNKNFYAITMPTGKEDKSGNPISYTKWDPKPHCIEAIQKGIKQKGLRLKMSDSGVQLPGTVPVVREVLLSKEVFVKYMNLLKDCIILLKSGPLFSEGIAKIMRLREVTSGFVIDAEETVHNLSNTPAKLDALQEILEEEIGDNEDTGKPHQVLIWCHFKKEYEDLKARFGSNLRVLADYSDRGQLLQDFIDNKFSYLVANPSSLGHGVTFVQCNYMVWYSFSYSSEQYYQANRRIARIGQTKTAVIFHLVAKGPRREDTVDDVLLSTIQEKLDNNEALLSVFKTKLEAQLCHATT